ncbi:uncharacterized protein LOC128679000 [Plodia interpunctella]|uniref:uncharacterized protein LOC128679000 n=1 Tax=Plodia interpunctella TaxID=58824 RepID=UPI0023675B5B|nr:uncharacterized protein LOC128679000 [Plodia interpunctella]
MKAFLILAIFALVFHPSCSRPSESEESVVSVYTTQATTAGPGKPFDVYHQIANNIAERITSPIYRFLGYDKNKTEEATTKKPWSKIELLDEIAEEVTDADISPVDNDISTDEEVEELSFDALKKIQKIPEKIVLYSNYLPVKGNLEVNDTVTDDEDPFEFNDDDYEKPRQNQFLYVLEVLGSLFQFVWGSIVSYFKPSTNSNPE